VVVVFYLGNAMESAKIIDLKLQNSMVIIENAIGGNAAIGSMIVVAYQLI